MMRFTQKKTDLMTSYDALYPEKKTDPMTSYNALYPDEKLIL